MTHAAKLLPIDFPNNAKLNYLLKMAEGKLNKRTPTASYAYLTNAPGTTKNARTGFAQGPANRFKDNFCHAPEVHNFQKLYKALACSQGMKQKTCRLSAHVCDLLGAVLAGPD